MADAKWSQLVLAMDRHRHERAGFAKLEWLGLRFQKRFAISKANDAWRREPRSLSVGMTTTIVLDGRQAVVADHRIPDLRPDRPRPKK